MTAKAPTGCYWRGNVLWGRAMVEGKMHWWSLETSDPAVAKKRQAAGKARLRAPAIARRHGEPVAELLRRADRLEREPSN